MKPKIEITFEMEETVILRQAAKMRTAFCPQCQAIVEMAMPQTVADLSDFTERDIFRLIERTEIHFLEEERVFVCLNSLTKRAGKFATKLKY